MLPFFWLRHFCKRWNAEGFTAVSFPIRGREKERAHTCTRHFIVHRQLSLSGSNSQQPGQGGRAWGAHVCTWHVVFEGCMRETVEQCSSPEPRHGARYSLGVQSVVRGPAAAASPGRLWEMRISDPTPHPLNQSLPVNYPDLLGSLTHVKIWEALCLAYATVSYALPCPWNDHITDTRPWK